MRKENRKKKNAGVPGSSQKLGTRIRRRWQLYLLLLLPVTYVIIFCYIPMGGLVIAFQDYNARDGIFRSPWVGLDNFRKFFNSYNFELVLKNTLVLSVYSLLITFPINVIFALLLNAMPGKRYKKVIQTVTYMPYFISAVVLVGLIFQLFNSRTGLYGSLYQLFTGKLPAPDILAKGKAFKHFYVWSAVWRATGYNAIIYIAALANVDMALHEAAEIDGASRFQRVLYIDIPSIMPTMSIMLILALGNLMGLGYEKAYLMQNSLNLDYSEIISTYVYKVGLGTGLPDYSLATAIGLFNSVINFILLITANWSSKKLSGSGIF